MRKLVICLALLAALPGLAAVPAFADDDRSEAMEEAAKSKMKMAKQQAKMQKEAAKKKKEIMEEKMDALD